MNDPIIEKTRGISPIWLLPLIALTIGGWLLYESIQSRGINITIVFSDVSGITAGKTTVMYRGMPVGSVTSMKVNQKAKSVKVLVKMDKTAKSVLVEDTKFWIVKPEVSADRIRGLDTILSGSYITLQPGTSTKTSHHFAALNEPPPIPMSAPGLHLTIETENLGSLQEGSGIYYRHIQVGSIQGFHLDEEAGVVLEVYIEEKYSHLVRESTRFWNASGITATGSLAGISVQVESLTSLLRGGIVMQTPASLKDTPGVKNGHSFTLYKNYEAAKYGIPITLQFATGEGIVEGRTKVMYRGMQAGIVKTVTINEEDPEHSVTAHILLDPRAEIICRRDTEFWLVRPQFSAAELSNLGTLISGA